MRTFGAVLAIAGLALAAYYFWVFDTSPNSIGGSFGGTDLELSIEDPKRNDDRKIGIGLGIGAALVGTLMFGLAKAK